MTYISDLSVRGLKHYPTLIPSSLAPKTRAEFIVGEASAVGRLLEAVGSRPLGGRTFVSFVVSLLNRSAGLSVGLVPGMYVPGMYVCTVSYTHLTLPTNREV